MTNLVHLLSQLCYGIVNTAEALVAKHLGDIQWDIVFVFMMMAIPYILDRMDWENGIIGRPLNNWIDGIIGRRWQTSQHSWNPGGFMRHAGKSIHVQQHRREGNMRHIVARVFSTNEIIHLLVPAYTHPVLRY